MNVLTVFICVIPLCCWTLTDLDLLYPVDSARDRCMKNPGYPVKVDVWQRYNPCPFSERNSPPLKGFSEENQALRSFLNNAKIKPTLNNAKLGLQRLPDASMTTPLLTEFPAINPVKRRDQMLNHDPLLAEMEMPRSMNPIRVMSPFNPGNISTGQTCISENFTLPFKHPIFRETLISSVGAFKYSLCGFLRRSLDQFNSFLTEAIHHPPSRLFQGCCLRSFSELFFNNMLIFLSNFLSLSTYLLFYFPAELLFKCHFFFLRFPILLIVLFVLMIQIFIGIPFLMLFAYYLVVYPLFNLSSVFCSVMILFIGFLRNTCHFGVFSAIRTLFFQVKGILVAVTRASQGFSIFSIPSYILDSCEEKSRNIVEASSNEHSVTGPFGPGLMDISPNASIQYLHRYRKPFLAMSDSSELKKRRLVNRANVRKPSLKTCHCSKACHCRINMKQKYTNSTSERDLQAGCRCRKFCTRTSGRYDGVKDIPPSKIRVSEEQTTTVTRSKKNPDGKEEKKTSKLAFEQRLSLAERTKRITEIIENLGSPPYNRVLKGISNRIIKPCRNSGEIKKKRKMNAMHKIFMERSRIRRESQPKCSSACPLRVHREEPKRSQEGNSLQDCSERKPERESEDFINSEEESAKVPVGDVPKNEQNSNIKKNSSSTRSKSPSKNCYSRIHLKKQLLAKFQRGAPLSMMNALST